MQVHILSEWHLGNGESILAVYGNKADAVVHAEGAAAHFNKTHPGYTAKKDSRPPTGCSESWSYGTGGWCIASLEVQ